MFKSHIFNWTFEPHCILTFSNNRSRKRKPQFVTSRGNAQNNSLKCYRLCPRLWHWVNGGKSSSKHISKNTPWCLKATSYHRTMAKNQTTVHTDQIKCFKAIFSICEKKKKNPNWQNVTTPKKYVLFGWNTGDVETMAGLEQITVLFLQFVWSWQMKGHSAFLVFFCFFLSH